MSTVVQLEPRRIVGEGIEAVEQNDGSLEVTLEGDESDKQDATSANLDPDNLLDLLDAKTKGDLLQNCLDWVRSDLQSRERWMQLFKQGMEKCGVLPDVAAQQEDVEGLSQVVHPLIVEAATQFQARAIAEVFPSSGPVKAVIVGSSDEDAEDVRNRVEQHMNYQLIEEDEEYFEDVDKMLFYVPFSGSAFKKTYYDSEREMTIGRFVSASDVIVPYTARSLLRTPRLTHRLYYSQQEMSELQARGVYSDVEIGRPALMDSGTQEVDLERRADAKEPSDMITDAEHTVYEVQARWDLKIEGNDRHKDVDGKFHDYIVSVEKDSRKLLSVRKNWRFDKKDREVKRQWFAHYKYLPGFGFYGYGLLHAIGGLGEAATNALRELLDSATFATRQGGFMSEEVRVPRGVMRLRPGVYQRTQNTADDLSRAFYSPPFKEPSPALVEMFRIIVEAGQRFGSITEAMTGQSNENTPVGTTVARIEQASMIYSAVHKRLHRAAAIEFKQRAILNSEWLSKEPNQLDVENGTLTISAQDYLGPVKVIPVSDPNITSTPQRIALAQNQLQLAQMNPGMYDKFEVNRRVLAAMRVPDFDKILINPEDVPANDAVTEGAMALTGQPIRAYPEQDHPSHITVHMGQLQMVQTTPLGPQVIPALMAHLAEHFALMYLTGMSQHLGIAFAALPMSIKDRDATPADMDQQISMAAAAVVEQEMVQVQQMAAAQGGQGGGPPQAPAGPSPVEQQAKDAAAVEKAKQEQLKTGTAEAHKATAEMKANAEAMKLHNLPSELAAKAQHHHMEMRGKIADVVGKTASGASKKASSAVSGTPASSGGEFATLLHELLAQVAALTSAVQGMQQSTQSMQTLQSPGVANPQQQPGPPQVAPPQTSPPGFAAGGAIHLHLGNDRQKPGSAYQDPESGEWKFRADDEIGQEVVARPVIRKARAKKDPVTGEWLIYADDGKVPTKAMKDPKTGEWMLEPEKTEKVTE